MILLIIWCLLPVATGWLLIKLALPQQKYTEWNYRLLTISIGAGLGQGLASLLFFYLIVEWRLPFSVLVIVEESLTAVLAGLWWRQTRCNKYLICQHTTIYKTISKLNILDQQGILFLVLCGLTVTSMGLILANHPIGDWDAWSFWNHRAIFLTAGLDYFYPSLKMVTHGDYPLLLPSLIARTWILAGIKIAWVPAYIAALWTAATIGIMIGCISLIRGWESAWMASFTLLGSWLFIRMGVRQYADMTLAFWVITTLACMYLREFHYQDNLNLLLLAGLCAGCAAWTKNEGMLLGLNFSGACYITGIIWQRNRHRHILKELATILLGLLPFLIMSLSFKIKTKVQNELFRPENILTNLTDWPRYSLILRTFGQQWFVFHNWGLMPYWLLIFPWFTRCCCNRNEHRALVWATLTILATLTNYFIIYIITPNNVAQHMSTSLERLYIHIWPALIFSYYLIFTIPPVAKNY